MRLPARLLQRKRGVATKRNASAVCSEDEGERLSAALTHSQVKSGDAACGVPVSSLRTCWLEATHENVSQMRLGHRKSLRKVSAIACVDARRSEGLCGRPFGKDKQGRGLGGAMRRHADRKNRFAIRCVTTPPRGLGGEHVSCGLSGWQWWIGPHRRCLRQRRALAALAAEAAFRISCESALAPVGAAQSLVNRRRHR